MKKVLAILLPILIIVGALVLLYLFVLRDMADPPPDKVVTDAIEAAQVYVNNMTEANETRFTVHFSERCRQNLQREWRAVRIDGTPRGSWYEIALGMLNSDQTQPEVLGLVEPEEGEEEEEEEAELQATVRIKIDRVEREIPLIREEGRWRIDIPSHPAPWTGTGTGT